MNRLIFRCLFTAAFISGLASCWVEEAYKAQFAGTAFMCLLGVVFYGIYVTCPMLADEDK